MNVLEQIRQRHHSAKSGGCSCGEPGPCDAAVAVGIALELYDAVHLSMSHLSLMTRRNERALLLAEDQAERFGLDPRT